MLIYCIWFVYFQKYLQASDFLQNVVYINLPLSDEDRVSTGTKYLSMETFHHMFLS